MNKKPLAGLKVLDFTVNVAGPTCTALLADFGCDVIKVERPIVGDDNRGFGPLGLISNGLNRGKKSLGMPLKGEESGKILRDLVEDADILVEAFRPGVMERLGLGYEDAKKINPEIIYTSISFYGHNSKYSQEGGYDMLAQARTGIMNMTGHPDETPIASGITMCDQYAGINAYGGILTALYNREKTGHGQHVDISLFNVGFVVNDYVEMAAHGYGNTRAGDYNSVLCPYGVYHNKAGSIIILAISAKLWQSLCELMGREDLITDPDYSSNAKRIERRDAVNEIVTNWLNTFDDIETPEKLLKERKIPCGKVLDNIEAVEHMWDAGVEMLVAVDPPPQLDAEKAYVRTTAMKLSETPGYPVSGAPQVGEHNAEILKELGYDEQQISSMIAEWNNA